MGRGALHRHQRLDAVGDELHGKGGEDDAEQAGEDRTAGLAKKLVDALGKDA